MSSSGAEHKEMAVDHFLSHILEALVWALERQEPVSVADCEDIVGLELLGEARLCVQLGSLFHYEIRITASLYKAKHRE